MANTAPSNGTRGWARDAYMGYSNHKVHERLSPSMFHDIFVGAIANLQHLRAHSLRSICTLRRPFSSNSLCFSYISSFSSPTKSPAGSFTEASSYVGSSTPPVSSATARYACLNPASPVPLRSGCCAPRNVVFLRNASQSFRASLGPSATSTCS